METMTPARHHHHDLDVIVIGRAGMDLYPQPARTKSAQATSFASDLGGSGGNIAVALARHGLDVGLVAPISADPVGEFVAQKLAHYGVEHLTPTPTPMAGGARTSLAIAESRAEDCEVVIYRNNAADFQLSDQVLDLAQIDRAPVLVVTGTALACEPSRSMTIEAMQRAAFVVLDLDYRAYSWDDPAQTADVYARACGHAQIIIGNDEEFDMIAPGRGQDWAASAAQAHAMVIYKMGARGSTSYLPNQEFETPIFAVDILKPFGAGDAFMGGVIAQLITASTPQQAVRFGSAAAAMVVSAAGCASAMPTTAQVQHFIAANLTAANLTANNTEA